MKIEFLILSIIKLSDNNLKGRTILQKIIYFFSILLKKEFGYQAHYYGPYSLQVENTLNSLKSLGYIKEEVNTWGVDERGFEKKKYIYSLSEDGEYLYNYLSKDNHTEIENIFQIFSLLNKHIDLNDSYSLSIAAKTYHIISKKSSSPIDTSSIKSEAKNLGWDVKEPEISEATNFLVGIELIRN